MQVMEHLSHLFWFVTNSSKITWFLSIYACKCLRGIWIVPSSMCFSFWFTLEGSGTWTGWSLKVSSNPIPSKKADNFKSSFEIVFWNTIYANTSLKKKTLPLSFYLTNNCWIINENHDIFLLLYNIKRFISRSCPFLFEAFTNTFQNTIGGNFQISIFQRASSKSQMHLEFSICAYKWGSFTERYDWKSWCIIFLTSFRFASIKPQKHGANDNNLDTPRFVCCLKISLIHGYVFISRWHNMFSEMCHLSCLFHFFFFLEEIRNTFACPKHLATMIYLLELSFFFLPYSERSDLRFCQKAQWQSQS